MLGKTHMAVGVATTLVVLQPDNFAELFVGTAMAVVGSVISDIDVDSSGSHKWASRIILFSLLATLLIVVLDSQFGLGISNKLLQHQDIKRILLGMGGIVIICAFGKEQPHRSFMHSLLALFALSVCVWVVFPKMVFYFAVSFCSHLCLDMLNCKRIRLWYPMKKGFCLKLCSADGFVNSILLLAGVSVGVIQFVWTLYILIADRF